MGGGAREKRAKYSLGRCQTGGKRRCQVGRAEGMPDGASRGKGRQEEQVGEVLGKRAVPDRGDKERCQTRGGREPQAERGWGGTRWEQEERSQAGREKEVSERGLHGFTCQ